MSSPLLADAVVMVLAYLLAFELNTPLHECMLLNRNVEELAWFLNKKNTHFKITEKMFTVYLLKSKTCGKTYVGFTTNPTRRLRQHNREIKGGAKKTKVGGPWAMVVRVSGFKTKVDALKFEWKWQHARKSKMCRALIIAQVRGKIGSLPRKMQELNVLLSLHPRLVAISTLRMNTTRR